VEGVDPQASSDGVRGLEKSLVVCSSKDTNMVYIKKAYLIILGKISLTNMENIPTFPTHLGQACGVSIVEFKSIKGEMDTLEAP
jgi:hypothetical protein